MNSNAEAVALIQGLYFSFYGFQNKFGMTSFLEKPRAYHIPFFLRQSLYSFEIRFSIDDVV